jgi:hypothetical protein
MKLLDGEVVPGDSLIIDADLKKGEVTFAPAKAKPPRKSAACAPETSSAKSSG